MIYSVSFDHVIERHVTVTVEAESEGEAIGKAHDQSNWIDDDEEFAGETGIETKNYIATIGNECL